jgi:hypothetical protein
LAIADWNHCRLPIADFRLCPKFVETKQQLIITCQSQIGNWQSAITKAPRQTTRGFQEAYSIRLQKKTRRAV